jgi:hypothetical protein
VAVLRIEPPLFASLSASGARPRPRQRRGVELVHLRLASLPPQSLIPLVRADIIAVGREEDLRGALQGPVAKATGVRLEYDGSTNLLRDVR